MKTNYVFFNNLLSSFRLQISLDFSILAKNFYKMANSPEDFNKRRLRSSNFTVVISIALVLFMVGLSGLIVINAQKYADYLKEQLVINAYFDQDFDTKDSVKILKQEHEAVEKIKSLTPVRKATYISRAQSSIEAKKSLGIDAQQLFNADIYPSSVEIALKASHIDSIHIENAIKEIKAIPGIVDVKNNSESKQVYNTLNKILKWIIGFSLLFLVLAIVLINNSIRLKIFSKRFIIKTMQLVGARRRFIIAPFLKEAVVLGLIGAVLGILALTGVWYYFTTTIETPFVQDENQYYMLLGGIILVGIFISLISTVFATWRFLSSNIDDLYYN